MLNVWACVCVSVSVHGLSYIFQFFFLFKTMRIIVRCFQCAVTNNLPGTRMVQLKYGYYFSPFALHVAAALVFRLHYHIHIFLLIRNFPGHLLFFLFIFAFLLLLHLVSHLFSVSVCRRCIALCECIASNSHLPTTIHLVALCTLFIFTDIQTDKK